MIRNSKALIILYLGNGKGKTTAAVGLAVRASGAGKKVLFAQFVKAASVKDSGEWPLSSEISVLKRMKNISVKVLGRGFVGILGDKKAHAEHARAAHAGLRWLVAEIKSRKYNIVIADELIAALELRLLSIKEVASIFKLARKNLEAFAVTGHKKYNKLINEADLVTEMKMVKHPYYKGMIAQRGIDF